ncbi:MAG: L-lactate permease [Chloroflexi bacterium]|nr:L-lactate permease [Chloroflexota bacterium]MCL5110250.1 L-lactate permease [Chloroflexota bacterium]MCL5110255.1 L-lactate permease [Chloroflexota bacterium]
MELTLGRWLLTFLPIAVLLVTIVGLKWGAPKAGAAAWFVALAVAIIGFGGDAFLVALASAKGLSLSIFVLSIIWSSVFLYNVAEQLGAPRVIGETLARLVADPLLQALVIAWCFSSFLQGITGFGVPVAVAAPLLIIVGVPPVQAAVMTLIGHSWAVTFGSVGSSYYTLQLVTRLAPEQLAPWMAFSFALPIITCGFGVAHVQGGVPAMRRAALPVLLAGSVMAVLMWLFAYLGAPQIASTLPSLVGCLVLWLVGRSAPAVRRVEPPIAGGSMDGPLAGKLGFNAAFLPYYALIGLTVAGQVPAVKAALGNVAWGLDYPAYQTSLGYQVLAENLYAKISLLSHPAPIIVAAALLSFAYYRLAGFWRPGVGRAAARLTVKQCVPTSVGIAATVMMALIMNDAGMTTLLAHGIANATGPLFPLLSPFIGVLGCFMTGSNTTSNVMFGALQYETARGLGVSTVLISAAQSVGGSLGSIVAPAKVLIGAVVVGLTGREGEVMGRAIPYCLVLVLLVGIQTWLFVYVLFRELT